MQGLFRALTVVVAVWFLGTLSGCHRPPREAPRVPTVTVTQAQEQEVTRFLEYTGTTQALEYVEIRARVSGFLQKIHFAPDALVKTGDLLFTIDPSQYQAAVNENAAQVESAKAKFKLAKIEEEMAKNLESQQAVSALKLQEKVANSSVAKADIDLAQSALDKSTLNLTWTKVVSPINGRASRNLVDAGNLVGATEKTLLTTVVNSESIYCYFSVNEADAVALRSYYSRGRKDATITLQSLKIPVYLGLAEETGYPHHGFIDYADTKLNPSTGTLQFRGIFPNEDGFLVPGMFARVRVPLENRKAVVIPGLAVQFDQGGQYVLVVNDENVVQQKRVKIGQHVEAMTVIEKGLTPQDRVITLGVQRARPGSKVNPTVPAAAKPGNASESKSQEK